MDPVTQAVSTTTTAVLPVEQKAKSEGKLSFCFNVFKNVALVATGAAGAYAVINYGETGKQLLLEKVANCLNKVFNDHNKDLADQILYRVFGSLYDVPVPTSIPIPQATPTPAIPIPAMPVSSGWFS